MTLNITHNITPTAGVYNQVESNRRRIYTPVMYSSHTRRSSSLVVTTGVILLMTTSVLLMMTAQHTHACEFTFYPNSINTPQGPLQMGLELVGPASSKFFEDEITARQDFVFAFTSRVRAAVNPRLCRYLVTENDNEKTKFDVEDTDRHNLSPEFGMPSARCMLNPNAPGDALTFYPKFSRAGALIPMNNKARVHPLCGDLFNFRKNQLLHFSGRIDLGLIRVSLSERGMGGGGWG
jgi:hypothetical protein